MNFEKLNSLISKKLNVWLETSIKMLPNLIIAILTLIVFYYLARLVRKGLTRLFARTKLNATINLLFSNTGYFLILCLGLFIALGALNLDKTVMSLLAGAGIIGLAFGFAFKDIASNFMSGILLAVMQPFDLEDIIKTKEYFGQVKTIGIWKTIIETFDGQNVVIPNNKVFSESLVNYSQTGRRRIGVLVGVSYGEDLKKVKDLLYSTVKNELREYLHPEREPDVLLKEFNDSSIDFLVRFWIPYSRVNSAYDIAKTQAILEIKRAFDREGITIPFPIRTLDFGIKNGKNLKEMLH